MNTNTKNHKLFLLFGVIVTLLISARVILIPFGDLDEIWVYNISRGITEGLVPYKDMGMVFMPLYNLIFAVPLLICRNLIVYRIMSAALLSAISLILMKAISNESSVWYALPVVLSTVLLMDTANYNYLLFLFALLIFVFNQKTRSYKRNVLLGVFAALAALSRQTTGSILIVAELVYILVDSEKRGRIKSVLMYLAGVSIPCFLFLIYLLATGSFLDFWDHCFFALFIFGSGNRLFDESALFHILISLVGILADIFLIKKSGDKKYISHLLIALTLLTIALPLIDLNHIIMAEMFSFIPIVRCVKVYAGKYLKPLYSIAVSPLLAIAVVFMAVAGLQGTYFTDRYNELSLIPVTDITEDYYQIAMKNKAYEEQGRHVVVLSQTSSLISLLEDECNYPFDLFQTGSLGTEDPIFFIEEILQSPDTIILMPDNYPDENFENPDGVFEYITDNCSVIDDYGQFRYYQRLAR